MNSRVMVDLLLFYMQSVPEIFQGIKKPASSNRLHRR